MTAGMPSSRWKAGFIAAARRHDVAGLPAPYFRTEFVVDDDLVSARLYVTGLGLVEAHCNGAVVGDEVLCPGWTAYDHRVVVREHVVTDLLRAGPNALGMIAGEGWAVGRVSDLGHRNLWSDRPCAFAQLELEYRDRVDIIGTDESWVTATGAIRSDAIYDGETYDARFEPAGWSSPGFDAAGWSSVELVDRDVSTLVAAESPPIRRIEELAPTGVSSTGSGAWMVDFGQVIAGWLRIRVEGEAGTTITIHHTEFAFNSEPRLRAEPNGAGDGSVHAARGRGRGVGAPFHLPRVPLCRGRGVAWCPRT